MYVNPRRLSHCAWKLVGRRRCDLQVGWGKVKKVTKIVNFTYSPRRPHSSDCHQIWFSGRFPRRNQLCQIWFQSVQGFRFCTGSQFGLSDRNDVSPLRRGLNYRYRSACEIRSVDLLQATTSKGRGDTKSHVGPIRREAPSEQILAGTITSRIRSAAIYPRPVTRTKRFTSSVQYYLLNYQ